MSVRSGGSRDESSGAPGDLRVQARRSGARKPARARVLSMRSTISAGESPATTLKYSKQIDDGTPEGILAGDVVSMPAPLTMKCPVVLPDDAGHGIEQVGNAEQPAVQ